MTLERLLDLITTMLLKAHDSISLVMSEPLCVKPEGYADESTRISAIIP